MSQLKLIEPSGLTGDDGGQRRKIFCRFCYRASYRYFTILEIHVRLLYLVLGTMLKYPKEEKYFSDLVTRPDGTKCWEQIFYNTWDTCTVAVLSFRNNVKISERRKIFFRSCYQAWWYKMLRTDILQYLRYMYGHCT